MKISQSAFPYLFLLFTLIVGIPSLEYLLQKKSAEEAIVVRVNNELNSSSLVSNFSENVECEIFEP